MCQLKHMNIYALPLLTICPPFVINCAKSIYCIKDGRSITEYCVDKSITDYFNNTPLEERK